MGPVIGRGSMARVYEAEHQFLCRLCAIKVLNPGLVARQPQIREQFWAEARVVANLIHPGVVTVHNLGTDRDYHFIEMEYVAGGISLKETLIKDGPFEPILASKLVHQVVQALGAAHRSGLVHRDVKPANVLLTTEGRAKLADFGLVRRLGELGRAGPKVAGTPTFMAPELFVGDPASPRSDLYAVGVMFYYLLSARLPFSADRISRLIHLHRHEPVPDIREMLPDLSEHLTDILARCLAQAASRLATPRPRISPTSSTPPSPSSATPRDFSARASRGSTASSRAPVTTSASCSNCPTTGSRRSTSRSARIGTTNACSRCSPSAARPS